MISYSTPFGTIELKDNFFDFLPTESGRQTAVMWYQIPYYLTQFLNSSKVFEKDELLTCLEFLNINFNDFCVFTGHKFYMKCDTRLYAITLLMILQNKNFMTDITNKKLKNNTLCKKLSKKYLRKFKKNRFI